jgi:hypothetical protein
MSRDGKQQLRNEITNIYNIGLKNKIKRLQPYVVYRYGNVMFQNHLDFVDFYFMNERCHLFLNSKDGTFYIEGYHTVSLDYHTMSLLRKHLKSLKKLVLYMV